MKDYVVTYAQNREDIILAGFFPADYVGFYVDIGANDPVKDSVTNLFYQRGWSGINVEPIAKHYNNLLAQRPRDLNLKVGVGTKRGSLTFREYSGDGLSTFSAGMKRQYEHAKQNGNVKEYRDYKVPVVRLEDIFLENSTEQIDFMKVDVEGYEYDVITSNNWEKYRPRVICIEANHVDRDWRPVLIAHGYLRHFFDGLNEYYVDEMAKPSISFDYVRSIIGIKHISNDVFEEMEQLEYAKRKLSRENEEYSERLAYLDAYLYQQSRLKNIVKNLVVKVHEIIVLHLSRAATPHRRYPLLDIETTTGTAEELHAALQVTDRRIFTRPVGLPQQIKISIAKLALQIYKCTMHFMYICMRFIVNGLRAK